MNVCYIAYYEYYSIDVCYTTYHGYYFKHERVLHSISHEEYYMKHERVLHSISDEECYLKYAFSPAVLTVSTCL